MDHAAAQRHLATTERLIIESQRSIARQREIIATLKCAGCDSETASIARALLLQMERRLERHAADRDWFRNICAPN
jgi:hypothetical protein